MLQCKVQESKPCPHQEREVVSLTIPAQLMSTCRSASENASTVTSRYLLWGLSQSCLVREPLALHKLCRRTNLPHFAQVPAASAGVQQSMEDYVQLLTAEIGAQLQLSEQPLQTIFFGGGTPSLVPPPTLQRILAVLEQQFGIASDAEISMEADPGTFDAQVPGKGLHVPLCGQAAASPPG